MQEHEQERGAEDGEGNENAPLSPAQGAPQRRTGAGGGREVEGRRGWLGGVGHLIRRLQALAAVPPGPSLLPRGGGAAMVSRRTLNKYTAVFTILCGFYSFYITNTLHI